MVPLVAKVPFMQAEPTFAQEDLLTLTVAGAAR